jgi:type II secretory pathway component PulF
MKRHMNEKHISTLKSLPKTLLSIFKSLIGRAGDLNDVEYLDWMLSNAYATELFEEVFNSNLEDALKRYTKSDMDRSFNQFLSQYASKKDVLQHQVQLSLSRRRRLEHILKLSAYPLFLWGMSIVVLTFLYNHLIPQAYQVLNLSLSWSFYLMQFLIGFKLGHIALALVVFFIIHKHYTASYLWFQKWNLHGFWSRWESLNYLSYLQAAIHLGIPFQTFVTFQPPINSIISHTNKLLENELNQGQLTYKSVALMDRQLSNLLAKSTIHSAFVQRLSLHTRYLEQRLRSDTHQAIRVFKLFVYLQTSVLVFSIYQLSLSPLKLMEAWS